MALFSSVIAYLIYYYALAHMAASRVSAFSYLQPPFATVAGRRGSWASRYLGAGRLRRLVILAGVYLAERG